MADVCNKQQFTQNITNPCNNEIIDIKGEEMDCYSVTSTPSGKLQYSFRSVIRAKGTGDFGNGYVLTANFGQIYTVNRGETFVQTDEQSVMLVSKGSAPNFIDKFSFHVTITPDGDLITETSHISSECRG